MTIEEQYHIIYQKGKRRYIFDMSDTQPVLDFCIPHRFRYKDIEIVSHAWNEMTVKILEAIDRINHKSDEELLNLTYSWSKTKPFSEKKLTNFTKFRDIYLNTNHTSTHSMMSLQMLLTFYGIPLKDVYFEIIKHHKAESRDVRNHYIYETKSLFKNTLEFYGYNSEQIANVLNCIDFINRYFPLVSDVFDNFYLFDNPDYFLNYKAIVLEYIEKHSTPNNYKITKKCLNLLYKNCKYRYFYMNYKNIGKWDSLNSLISQLMPMIFDPNEGAEYVSIVDLCGIVKVLTNSTQIINQTFQDNIYRLTYDLFKDKYAFIDRKYIALNRDVVINE